VVKGEGLIAVRKRIEAAFQTVHGDHRDREQLQADHELRVSLEADVVDVLEDESGKNVRRRVEAYCLSALRNPTIARNSSRRSNIGGAWLIEEPKESAIELLRQLEQG